MISGIFRYFPQKKWGEPLPHTPFPTTQTTSGGSLHATQGLDQLQGFRFLRRSWRWGTLEIPTHDGSHKIFFKSCFFQISPKKSWYRWYIITQLAIYSKIILYTHIYCQLGDSISPAPGFGKPETTIEYYWYLARLMVDFYGKCR